MPSPQGELFFQKIVHHCDLPRRETAGGQFAHDPIACVVALEDLTISVVSEDEVSQPLPGPNLGTTRVVNRTRIDVESAKTELQPVSGGATVAELLGNLKALQLSPRQLIQVFEQLQEGGYLQAPLQVR